MTRPLMSPEYIERHRVADRYLHGELTPEEHQAFEAYILDNPEVLGRLETDWMLREGLRSVGIPRRGSTRPTWAIAAGLGAAAVAGLLALSLQQASRLRALHQDLVALQSPRANVAILRVQALRSSNQTASILPVSEDVPAAVIIFELSLPEEPAYRVSIRRRDTTGVIAEFDRVVPREAGDIAILLSAGQLEPGEHVAIVSGRAGVVAEFSFDVTKSQ